MAEIEACAHCNSPWCVQLSEEETWQTMSNASSFVMSDPSASWEKYQRIKQWLATRGVHIGHPEDLSHCKIENQRRKVLQNVTRLGKAPMLRRLRTCEVLKMEKVRVAEPSTPQPEYSPAQS